MRNGTLIVMPKCRWCGWSRSIRATSSVPWDDRQTQGGAARHGWV